MSKILPTTTALALAIAAIATLGAAPTPARADANAPVCVTYYDGGASSVQCNFYTYAQCQASASGRGGTCGDNLHLRESLARAPRNR